MALASSLTSAHVGTCENCTPAERLHVSKCVAHEVHTPSPCSADNRFLKKCNKHPQKILSSSLYTPSAFMAPSQNIMMNLNLLRTTNFCFWLSQGPLSYSLSLCFSADTFLLAACHPPALILCTSSRMHFPVQQSRFELH